MKIVVCGEDYKYCQESSKNYKCNTKKGFFGKGIINSKNDPYKVTRIGLLGEMAFAKYMDVPARFEYMEHGDDFDFKINGKTIDVKTASRNYGACLIRCINHKGNFILKKPCDIYVAAYIDKEIPDENYAEVIIKGWIRSKEFKNMEPVNARVGKHKNYEISFDNVSSLSSLKKLLTKNEKNKPSTRKSKSKK